MERRYSALRLVATLYRVLGWIVIVLGTLSACGGAALAAASPRFIGQGVDTPSGLLLAAFLFAYILLWTILVGLGLLAISEGIQVFLDIEANTREAVALLHRSIGSEQRPVS